MAENKILKLTYTFFLGLLLAIFVGVGINTFYEPPAEPKYPFELTIYGKEMTPAQIAAQKEFDKQTEAYQAALRPYNRNVSMLTLGAAVVLLAVSVAFEKRIKVISDGVMLGGLFALVYSIGRGFASESSGYVFTAVAVSLVIALFLGYRRFVGRAQQLNPKR